MKTDVSRLPGRIGPQSWEQQPRGPLSGGVALGLSIVADLLRLEVQRLRAQRGTAGDDPYRGLFLSEADVEALIRQPGATDPDRTADAIARSLRARLGESLVAEGPLRRLHEFTGLSPLEAGCLLLCLACETDFALTQLVAYAQDDVSQRSPRVELALRLFTPPEGQAAARGVLAAGSTLRRFRLLRMHNESGQPHTPLLRRYISLDPSIAEYLLGGHSLDESLAPHSETWFPAEKPAGSLPVGLRDELERLGESLSGSSCPPVIALAGGDAVRLREAAATFAGALGRPLLCVAFPPVATDLGTAEAMAVAVREAGCRDAVLLLESLEGLKPEAASDLGRALGDRAKSVPLLLASSGSLPWASVTIEIPDLDVDGRRTAWATGLVDESAISGDDLDAIAGRFRLTAARITAATEGARGRALFREPSTPQVLPEDLYAAARAQSAPILSDLAWKIAPHYSWNDIVVPPDVLAQLHEIQGQIEHRHTVFDTWNFDRKLAMGKGMLALFAGPSGTGKTMAADILAGALGLDLYRIDLSGVVSKYIGETEKNLSSIFSEAETSNAILFFDEADALFGKRSEVKDAHDRYANIETAYLLQRMEEYSGAVILATNLKMNLDEAFTRRLHMVVDFPLPGEDERRRIWQSTIPAAAPLSEDVDFDFLARQFKISGGNIRNIVLAAAFLAAGDGQQIGMAHLIRATRREFQKLGKMVTEADFGSYVSLLRQ